MLLALKHNPALAAAGLAVETAEADMANARARFLPTVNFSETYNFSNRPSQVFMSKLNQRVFTSQDFLLNNLNNPNAYGNFRTGLVMPAPVPGGRGHPRLQAGPSGPGDGRRVCPERPAAGCSGDPGLFRVAAGPGEPGGSAAGQATAGAHLKIAQTRFQAGTTVHSDVLSAQVHLAKLTQEEMTVASQVQIARSALVTVMGAPEAGERPLAPPPKARRRRPGWMT